MLVRKIIKKGELIIMNENKEEDKVKKNKCNRFKEFIKILRECHLAEYIIIFLGVIGVMYGIKECDIKEWNYFVGKEVCSFLLIICGIVLLVLEKYFEKRKVNEEKIVSEIMSIKDENIKFSLIKDLITPEDDN